MNAQISALIPKSAPRRALLSASAFSLPIILFYYLKVDHFISSGRFLYDAGVLSSIFGGLIGLTVGVWLTTYSILYFLPKQIIATVLYGSAHAVIWIGLFVLFTNIFLRYKFGLNTMVLPPMLPTLQLYIECFAYSATLLFVTQAFVSRIDSTVA